MRTSQRDKLTTTRLSNGRTARVIIIMVKIFVISMPEFTVIQNTKLHYSTNSPQA